MNLQPFTTRLTRVGDKVYLPLPFAPPEQWGKREVYHVRGTVQNHPIRGPLQCFQGNYYLAIGPAWLRDTGFADDAEVAVILAPEGPLLADVAPDVATALSEDPDVLDFFESLPTFYRKNFIRDIESAKRPQTRATRIAEMMQALHARQRQK